VARHRRARSCIHFHSSGHISSARPHRLVVSRLASRAPNRNTGLDASFSASTSDMSIVVDASRDEDGHRSIISSPLQVFSSFSPRKRDATKRNETIRCRSVRA
jgi:hypothetical protein